MKNLKFAAAGIVVCASMLFTACSGGEKTVFVHSTVDSNGKFTCELLGIGADFDTNVWEFYSDTDIASVNSVSSVSNEDLKSALNKSGALQDMGALQEDGTNVLLIYEDTDVTKLGNVNEDTYIDKSVNQLEAQLAGVVDNVSSEKVTVTVAGASHAALDVTGETSGVSIYSRNICIRKGNLVALISINAFSKEAINEITSMFYAL